MSILVTGASGFVGTALTRRLRAEGRQYRVAARRDDPGSETVLVGDLSRHVDWSAAVDGVDTVLHLAGRAHVRGKDARSDRSFIAVNVEATRSLAEAAAAAGVRRLVLLSTAKVMGEESPDRSFRETDTPHPVGPYAISKLQAEEAATEVSRKSSLSLVILRSPLVYGPGVRANFLTLLRAVDRGIPLPFGSVTNERSMIALDNLVDALLACADQASPASEVYFAKDREDLSIGGLIRVLARALDRKPRLVPIPPRLLRSAARAVGLEQMLVRLVGSFTVDATRIAERLGWRPPVSLSAAIDDTVHWYRTAR